MRLYIHLGIHKTASTFLQNRFFPILSEIKYCNLRKDYNNFLEYFLSRDDLEFCPQQARNLLCNGINLSDKKVLISDEQFYGNVWDGCALRNRHCTRLNETFSEATIIIVFRNQVDLLESLYLQYIKTGGSAHWTEFLKANKHPLILSTAYFKFGEYAANLIKLFGKDKVKILLYEDMKSQPVEYLNCWCTFLGVNDNTWDKKIIKKRDNFSLSPAFVNLMRFGNKFISSIRQPYLLVPIAFHDFYNRFFMKLSIFFPSRSNEAIIPHSACQKYLADCQASNKLLENIMHRDLSELGYLVEKV